jgi:hypothetical protein
MHSRTIYDAHRAFAFTTGQMLPHYDELMHRPVAEVMTEAVVHVEQTAPLTRVLQLMVSLKNRSFPVIGSDRQLLGMISREDLMRALKEATPGRLEPRIRTRDFTPNPNIRDVNVSAQRCSANLPSPASGTVRRPVGRAKRLERYSDLSDNRAVAVAQEERHAREALKRCGTVACPARPPVIWPR